MSPELIGDLFNEALWIVVVIVTVIIMPSLVIGLVISTLQAATQINEQTLSFLPRLLITLITMIVLGPWLVTQVIDYADYLYLSIPVLLE